MPSIPASNTDIALPQPEKGDLQAPGTSPDPAHAATVAQFNEAGVRNAQANWLDGMNALLYAPDTGYFNQRGGAAMGSFQPLQDAMGKLYQQAQDNLGNDTQRGLFAQATAPLLDAFQARIHQHAQTQGRVYDADASQSRALSARDLAINAWNPAPGADNSNYRQCAAILHNELENQFRHAWGDPAGDNHALWAHYLQHGPHGDDGMASLTTGVVNRLLANDQPHDARAFLDQVQHTLPEPTRDKLGQFVTAALDQHAGNQAALQAQAASNDPAGSAPAGRELASQQQKLDTLRDDGHISAQAHAIATHKIQADQAAKLATQQQNDTQTLQKVWALKNANPHAALTDLGSADYAYLKSRGLDTNALAILQSHPATDDPGLFNQLHRLSTQDPVQFGKANLLTHSGQLSKAHMDYLTGLQNAINKQDPQAMQAGRRINMTVNALTGGTQSGGTADDPTVQGMDIHAKQDQAHELEAGLRDHLIAAQQNDPKLTLEDLHAAGAYFLKDWSLYGDGYGARMDAQQAQNGYLLSPELLKRAAAARAADQAPQRDAAPAQNDPETPVTAQSGVPVSRQSPSSDSPGASSDSPAVDPEDIVGYDAPESVWGVNGFQNIPIERPAYPLTGLAHRPYAIGEKFTHGVVAAGNGYPFDRVMVAQAPGDEKEVNLKQLCGEANLDCGLIKMLNDIPLDQTTIPNGAKLLLPNYTDDSDLPPGEKLRKRVDLTHAYSEYLAAMKEVRKNPQMMQYMEQDKTGDPFRAIAYVRGTPVPSNDWSVLNWLRVAENGRNHSTENPERIQTVANYLGLARKDDHRDVVISRDGKSIVDNNLVGAERLGTMKSGVWDFFPLAQPMATVVHRIQKALPSYHGGSTDVDFVEKWGLEGDRLRQLDKERKKTGQ